MKTLLKSLFILIVVTIPSTGISAQQLSAEVEEKVRAEIETQHAQSKKVLSRGTARKSSLFTPKFEP